MYSWGSGTDDWARPGAYGFSKQGARARAADAARADRRGPRSYSQRSAPGELASAKKAIATRSRHPLVVLTDVTGSMRQWPAEIFDRLPLLYQTLSQYRPDLEIAFASIGHEDVNRYPIQVTDFARGFELEERLGAIYGEGGGCIPDPRESYGLFAWYARHRISIPDVAEKPFLIVYGDVSMQPRVTARHVREYMGVEIGEKSLDAVATWRAVAETWNVWFLSRPGRLPQQEVDAQWARAIGAQKIVHLEDELRAVDYALGLVARAWGHFDDVEKNMRARQDEATVAEVARAVRATRLE